MFVMGIPLVFFMIGLLYFVIGLGEELVLRERIQDAADAGAMTGAMVYARGMNLIALINQLMAALVGLLIMVRMLEGVMIATVVVATALAWPTGGTSMSVVPTAKVAQQEANIAYTQLQNVVNPTIQALHALEIGIQYGMPAIAELQTIDVIKSFGDPIADSAVPGFEIPGQLFLPLKKGRWPRLCGKAGEAAGALIAMPIEALIPIDAVSDIIEAGLGGLTQAFSGYFCNSQSGTGLSFPEQVPSVPIPKNLQFNENLPPLASSKACEDATVASAEQGSEYEETTNGLTRTLTDQEKQQKADKRAKDERAIDEICRKAAIDMAMSQMAEDGGPMTLTSKAAGRDQTCAVHWGDGATYNCPKDCRGQTVCAEFQHKVDGAHAACGPGDKQMESYNYQRRDLKWQVDLQQLPLPPGCNDPEKCFFDVMYVTPEPQGTDVAVLSKDPPCGSRDATIGPDYVRTPYRPDGRYADDEYVCSTKHKYVEPSELKSGEYHKLEELRKIYGTDDPDSGWTLEMTEHGALLTGSWSAVTYMHSCDRKIEKLSDTKRKMEEKKPPTAAQDECKDSQDNVHMEMEDATEDNVLGGKVYQIRSIAFRREPDSFARDVVRSLPMRTRDERTQEPDNPLSAAGDVLSMFFAAQAEYYFDSEYEQHTEQWDQTKTERAEWAWHMQWKARLRRLRFMDDGSEESTCGEGWESQGTRLKDKPEDKCKNSGSSGSSSGGGSGSDQDNISRNTTDVIQEKLGLAGGLDVNAQLGGALEKVSGAMQNAGVPGAGGKQSNQSGQSAACGSVSTSRQLESLMIH
jgi:hypothetical protein